MIKYRADDWTNDPNEVAKVESLPWYKFIRLLDDEEVKEKKLKLDYLPIDKVNEFQMYFFLHDIHFYPKEPEIWFEGIMLSDEAYKIVKRNAPEILVLLGCDNGH